ncbi:tetratricopeptide repeat protein [Flavobacterium sp.]|uniref:tetratricopeptide repeat protein n=1 Tax=Flavobacterium sp. TaxID=239 RepID=UPI0031CF353E
MNVTDYTYLMNKPDAITEKQTEALGSVLNEFPYFQSARALRLKGLYSQNSFKYNYALKVAAAHTADRSVLFDFITSEKFTSIQNEFYDQKLKDLLEINVLDSEIVSFDEVKKTPEVRIDPIEQSILKSIKEATTVVFEKPSEIVEKTEEAEETAETVEETIIEPPIAVFSEEEILDSFVKVTEAEEVLDDSALEPAIAIPTEEEILNTFEAVTTETEEITEEVIPEEESIISPSEEEILNTFIPVIDQPAEIEDEQEIFESFEEVTETETEEIPEPIIEDVIAAPSEEEILNTFKEVENENKPAEIITEQPVVKLRTHTFFDEFVDDEEEEEIAEPTVDPAEEAVLVSIIEPANVVFEAPEVIEESKIDEEAADEEEIIEVQETEKTEVSEIVKTAEENLEIGKPIDFKGNEKHSFQEWLQLARTEPIDRTKDTSTESDSNEKKSIEITENASVEDEKKKKAEIIDRFIEANPKISPIKPTMANPSIQLNVDEEENSYLMTETLARVYLEQKKYTKAIQAYEILILKYPEKITFFADRISDIKILQQNNNNN